VIEQIGLQSHSLKLSQQVDSIYYIFHVSLLETYVYNRRITPELPLPIEVNKEKKYVHKEILKSAYWYNAFCRVKNKGYSAKERKRLPVENLRNAPDMVWEFHKTHPNLA
jgi:hypothetical protein